MVGSRSAGIAGSRNRNPSLLIFDKGRIWIAGPAVRSQSGSTLQYVFVVDPAVPLHHAADAVVREAVAQELVVLPARVRDLQRHLLQGQFLVVVVVGGFWPQLVGLVVLGLHLVVPGVVLLLMHHELLFLLELVEGLGLGLEVALLLDGFLLEDVLLWEGVLGGLSCLLLCVWLCELLCGVWLLRVLVRVWLGRGLGVLLGELLGELL